MHWRMTVFMTLRLVSFVQAEEQTQSRRFALAKLTINVKPVDSNPPVIHASASEGFVDENAPVGTKVVDSAGKPILITVTDADLVSIINHVVCILKSASALLLRRFCSLPWVQKRRRN